MSDSGTVRSRSRRRPPNQRDPYADFLRSFSLLVVILWHWCFTIIVWRDDGPTANSPLGFTSGLWILTWLLQVMPIFFYIGAFVHLQSWDRASARGEKFWHFAVRQAKSLAIPSGALLLVWIVIGIVVTSVFDIEWMWTAVIMVVSPLWFVATYLVFILMMPLTVWLHRRYDMLVLVVMGGLAIIVDILRFRYQIPYVEYVNMIFVWGFAFQLGFFHDRVTGVRDAPRYSDGRIDFEYQSEKSRQLGRVMTAVGLFALVGLVFSGLYPGSMVGVPGQGSNMAPPTVCIIALTIFQVGFVELMRPAIVRALSKDGWFAKVMGVFTRFSLPLFLFHTTGMALSRGIEWSIFGRDSESTVPDLNWWLLRPVAILGPLICTLPVIYLFGRKWQNKPLPVTRRPDLRGDDDVGDGGDPSPEPRGRRRTKIPPT